MSVLSSLNPIALKAVMFMTDDGISLHLVRGKNVTFIGSNAWKDPNFDENILNLLMQVKGASVVILNDAVEQHYRKERVVVVTMMDKKNMVQRRLNVAFPNYSMRAAMPLKVENVKGAKSDAVKGDPYLFAAVPSTETYARVVRALALAEVNISGYGLLPVESVELVKTLSQKLAQRWGGVSGASWSILIGQHHGGGLRQIVVRGNELALTRVTAVDLPDPNMPDVWAGDVSHELQATLSYLSRFGYVPEDGINIMVVGDTQYISKLEEMITVPCNFEALSPDNAASILGSKVAAGVDYSHFSDCIHAGWVAKKISLTLPLTSRDLSAISVPRQRAMLAMLFLNFAFAACFFLSSDEAQKIYFATTNLEVAEMQKFEITKIYQEEVARKERMGIDVNLIKGSLDIYGRLQSQRTDIVALIRDVSHSLETIRIDGFEYNNAGYALMPSTNTPSTNNKIDRNVTMVVKVSFSGTVNPKDGNKEMEELRSRIAQKIEPKGFSVVVSTPLEDQTYKGEVTKEVGLTAISRASTDRYHAEITIKKVRK